VTIRTCTLAGCALMAAAATIVIVGLAAAEIIDEARGYPR
jgi:hypothetical protein